MVVNIKPLRFPIPNLTAQSIWDILIRHARMKLEISTPYPTNITKIGTQIQGKKTLEKIKMRINSKKGLTNLNKNSYVQNGFGGQMMKLNPLEEKKTPQEVANGNSKATLNKCFEKNNIRNLFKRPNMTLGQLPLNQGSGLQKTAANKR